MMLRSILVGVLYVAAAAVRLCCVDCMFENFTIKSGGSYLRMLCAAMLLCCAPHTYSSSTVVWC